MKIQFGYKELELPDNVTFNDLSNHIEVEFGIPKNRQRISTFSGQIYSNDTILKKKILIVKDLGPQFSYRGVFILEYLGPVIILFLMKLFNRGYGNNYAFYMWIIHFLKREFETLFIHNFSKKTMPLYKLYKNCIYNYTFAILIGYEITTCELNQNFSLYWFIWVVFQVINFYSHILQRFNSSNKKQPPKNIIFKYVCCPNYTSEICVWLTYSIITGSIFSYLYTLCAAFQMFYLSRQKQAKYKKNIKGFNTKALIPFLI